MPVTVGTFDVSVVLFKAIDRKGALAVATPYIDSQRTIDLTPYLGENSTIRTIKSVREPAGGFSFDFGDQMDPATRSSVSDLIEPMDMVEIRVSREPWKYVGGKLPLLMRGFVSQVRRRERIGEDGSPQRLIVVRGQDFGKLWLTNHVFMEAAVSLEKKMITQFGLSAAVGLQANMKTASAFIEAMTTEVMNPKIATLSAIAQHQIPPFDVSRIGVTTGSITPAMSGGLYGSLWQIIANFSDVPWNELFIAEAENGPQVVYREVPYKGIDGKLIMPHAVDAGTVKVDVAEVISLDVERSDEQVANFFWVPPGAMTIDSNNLVCAAELTKGTNVLDFDYGNNDPDLYGIRRMDVASNLTADGVTGPLQAETIDKRQGQADFIVQRYVQRIDQLKSLSRDNSVFEDGGVELIGRETYTIGQNLSITRGDVTFEGYMHAVSHTIQVLTRWSTSVGLERGTGFLRRREIKGPYLAENRSGPYS